jgi:TPR repeat protein
MKLAARLSLALMLLSPVCAFASGSLEAGADDYARGGDALKAGKLDEAAKFFQRAAEQNHPLGAYHLGLMYETGEGMPQDFAAAARWYHVSAKHHWGYAPPRLGLLYLDGAGVAQNDVEACAWLTIALPYSPGLAMLDNVKALVGRLTPGQNQACEQRLAQLQREFSESGRAAQEAQGGWEEW